MTIRVALAVAAISLAAASTATAAKLERGQSGYLATKALACPSTAALAKVLKVAGDDFDAAVSASVGEGCRSFDKGTEVFVNESRGPVACVIDRKVRGDCMWTVSDRVVPVD